MRRRLLVIAASAIGILATLAGVQGQEIVKIGLILPMTGPFASTGRQIEAAARLYMQQNGATVAGKKVELIVKDDTGVADTTRRIAQELIVNDKVDRAGGLRAHAAGLATAPLATQAKVPEVVMAAATSMITEASPYIVRTSFTVPQAAVPMAEWAAQNGIKKVVTIVSDYGPGHRRREGLLRPFVKAGGKVENFRVPLAEPGLLALPAARGRRKARRALRLRAVGRRCAVHEAVRRARPRQERHQADRHGRRDRRRHPQRHGRRRARHDHDAPLFRRARSPENKAFVDAFKKANNGMRPNFMAVGGYDGMHLIYEGLKKTNGAGGEALVNAMKGMSWTSPRGPISIDPQTRDIVQNIYMRKVERVGGELYNVEFATIPNVKDPVKAQATEVRHGDRWS